MTVFEKKNYDSLKIDSYDSHRTIKTQEDLLKLHPKFSKLGNLNMTSLDKKQDAEILPGC